MKYFLTCLGIATLIALLLTGTIAKAQVVPAQNQIIPSAYFGDGYLISTSTSPTHKLGASLIDLAGAFITGTLGVANGGTGSTTLTGILKGNGTSQIGSLVVGSGLTYDGTTLSATGGGSGTVTQIDTTYPVTGGSITTTGTIGLAFGTTTDNQWSGLNTFSNSGTTTFAGGAESGISFSAPYFVATSSTATSTFAGDITMPHLKFLTTHGIRGDASDGVYVVSNNYTNVALFGAGGGAGATFYGGVNIDGATRLATSLTGLLKATSGAVSTATADVDYQVPLTFGDGLTRTVDDVDCDIASGSVFGCLSSTDWTTFNNKQSAITFGANVLTALGVDVGTAGAFVVNGGALGTPSSGTLTNATGLPPAGINLTKGNFLVGNDAGVAQATSTIFISSTGRIGINNTSPTYHLDVGGFINTDQYSGYKQNGATILFATTSNSIYGGSEAGGLITSGQLGGNAAFGYQAMYNASSTAADNNVAIGSEALKNSNGNANVAVGYQAMLSGYTAASNVAIGYQALMNNVTGSTNVAIGASALANKTSGNDIVAVGPSALAALTTGISHVGIGYNAGSKITTNASLTAVGASALRYTTGGTNTGVGEKAGQGTDGASTYTDGTFIGSSAGLAVTTGIRNTALGASSATSLTTGARNVCLGAFSCSGLSTGSSNIGIGFSLGFPDATGSEQLNIGSAIWGTFVTSDSSTPDVDARIGIGSSTPQARLAVENIQAVNSFQVNDSAVDTSPFVIDASGNVGIGTTSPYAKLSVVGQVVGSYFTATTTATSTFAGGIQGVTGYFSTLLESVNTIVTTLLRIPYGASPTVATNGDIGIDSTSNQFKFFSGGAVKVLGNGNVYPAFTYSTTTAWTGTTTIPLGTAYVGETWNGVQCFTDTGTLGVSFYDGTNRMTYVPTASTTVNTNALTTNNTFTATEKRYVDIGTPASSPTKISCTVSKSITAD